MDALKATAKTLSVGNVEKAEEETIVLDCPSIIKSSNFNYIKCLNNKMNLNQGPSDPEADDIPMCHVLPYQNAIKYASKIVGPKILLELDGIVCLFVCLYSFIVCLLSS